MKKVALEATLTHLCAGASLAYAVRSATFAATWIDVPEVTGDPGPLPYLSIVVPARNEERSIERCVRSLLAQAHVDYEVVVVDDGSTDATPAILARLAAEDPRLRVVRGAALPSGWVGKPWALAQGARVARGRWLLFTDADSWHAPHASASTLSFALRAGLDALSIATLQELETPAERIAIPAILGTVLFVSGPLGAINDPRKPRRALANGQYLLVSRAAYDALGGHAALRGEIVEDVAFARRIKADGRFRFALAGGGELVRVRMYRSFAEIWHGFTKNAFAGARGNVLSLALGIAFMLSTSLVPPLLALFALARRRPLLALEALCCTCSTVATSSWAMTQARLPRRYGLYQPLGSILFAAIALDSAVRVLSGRGVEWRGRTYTGRTRQGRGDA